MTNPEGRKTVVIDVHASGNAAAVFRSMSKNIGDMNKNIFQASNSMRFFSNILGFTIAGLGLRQFAEMSDSVQTLKDRLKILTGSSETAGVVFEKLRSVASKTKTSVADLGIIYSRLSNSTKQLGVSQQDVLNVTEALQNSFRLSGATTAEATSASIQLSQGFASGQLRGQELRSVLEANVVVGDLLSNTLGKTRGEIYKLAEAGKLTSDVVFSALKLGAKDINKEAQNLSQTFGQSLTVSMDQLRIIASDLNEKLGLSNGLAAVVSYVATNVDKLTVAIGLLGSAFALLKIGAILTNLGGLGSVITKISGFVATAANAILGLSALAASFVAAAVALAGLGVYFAVSEDGLQNFKEAVVGTASEVEVLEKKIASINERGVGALDFGGKLELASLSNALTFAKIEAEKTQKALEKLANTKVNEQLLSSGRLIQDKVSGEIQMNPAQAYSDNADEIARIRKLLDKPAEYDPTKPFRELNALFKSGAISADKYGDRLRAASAKAVNSQFTEGKKNLFDREEALNKLSIEELNRSLDSGKVSATAYFDKLDELKNKGIDLQSAEGKKSPLETASSKNAISVEALSRSLSSGAITNAEYKTSIENISLANLDAELKAGAISLDEYERKIVAVSDKLGFGGGLRVGITNYLEQIGTVSSQIASATSQAFSSLETSLADSLVSMDLDFKNFTKSVLTEISKIALRTYLLGPLAQGIGKLFETGLAPAGSGGGGGGGGVAGVGGIGSSTLSGKALGPVSFNGGSTQAGSTTVNIINQSGSEVQQKESVGADGSKMIEILIASKVREGIASGVFDSQFNQTFGLKRKGV